MCCKSTNLQREHRSPSSVKRCRQSGRSHEEQEPLRARLLPLFPRRRTCKSPSSLLPLMHSPGMLVWGLLPSGKLGPGGAGEQAIEEESTLRQKVRNKPQRPASYTASCSSRGSLGDEDLTRR